MILRFAKGCALRTSGPDLGYYRNQSMATTRGLTYLLTYVWACAFFSEAEGGFQSKGTESLSNRRYSKNKN